jgi:hypothetical protein
MGIVMIMKIIKLFFVLASLSVLSAFAQYKVSSALIPIDGETHLLVSIYDRNCESNGWNASLSNTNESSRGCWYQEGDLIKIRIQGTDGVRVFPLDAFKFMGLSKPQNVTAQQPKQQSPITLSCVADAWFGDIVVERNQDGTLKSLVVSGEVVNASEVANAINFTFKGLNISLSTLTGVFNYETSGLQKYLNNRLLGVGSTKGAGLCKINTSAKQF